MITLTRKEENRIVYPVVVSKEIEEDQEKFDTMLGNIPEGQKYFIPMSSVPKQGAVAGQMEKMFRRRISKKSECVCGAVRLATKHAANLWGGVEEDTRLCCCYKILKARFVKLDKEYGLLVEWLSVDVSKERSGVTYGDCWPFEQLKND